MKILGRFSAFLFLIVLLLSATGCIRSRVIIASDPPGANVVFNGVPQGPTPVTIPFIWHWYYDVDLEKEGYQPVHSVERFHTPPWFYFPLDFVMELLPIPITDTHRRSYVLEPLPPEEY